MSRVRGHSDVAAYSFSVTDYAGYEDEILRLRNTNRSDEKKNREYLDWRYAASGDTPQPKVFWILSAEGERVGMASLIFRLYWVDGKPIHLAVLGDISLDERARGKGVGQELLRVVSNYIEETNPESSGIVMPNKAAERSLAAVGWITIGQLTPYVLLLDPSARALAMLKQEWLASCCAWPIIRAIKGLLWLHPKRGFSLSIGETPNESLDALWRSFPKSGKIIRDRSRASLAWRFVVRPHSDYKFATFIKNGKTVGYLVFELSRQVRMCSIYEILAEDEAQVVPFLALFALHCARMELASSIRLLLNDAHPYAKCLWRLGFSARPSQGVFQTFDGNRRGLGSISWMISAGDKDV